MTAPVGRMKSERDAVGSAAIAMRDERRPGFAVDHSRSDEMLAALTAFLARYRDGPGATDNRSHPSQATTPSAPLRARAAALRAISGATRSAIQERL
jgi:hypothetical protein